MRHLKKFESFDTSLAAASPAINPPYDNSGKVVSFYSGTGDPNFITKRLNRTKFKVDKVIGDVAYLSMTSSGSQIGYAQEIEITRDGKILGLYHYRSKDFTKDKTMRRKVKTDNYKVDDLTMDDLGKIKW
jgi:hypothetical protein